MRLPYRALPGLLLAALAGCGAVDPSGPVVGPTPSDQGLPVSVENGSPANLRVFVVKGGGEILLGRVRPLRTGTFTLPLGMTGEMRLVVRPSNSRSAAERHVSQAFNLSAGHRVAWRLQASPGTSNLPNLSTITVFACGEDGC